MTQALLLCESLGELTEVPSEELEPQEYVGLGGSCLGRESRMEEKSNTPEEKAGADMGGGPV